MPGRYLSEPVLPRGGERGIGELDGSRLVVPGQCHLGHRDVPAGSIRSAKPG